jgi:hypothetical protein
VTGHDGSAGKEVAMSVRSLVAAVAELLDAAGSSITFACCAQSTDRPTLLYERPG